MDPTGPAGSRGGAYYAEQTSEAITSTRIRNDVETSQVMKCSRRRSGNQETMASALK